MEKREQSTEESLERKKRIWDLVMLMAVICVAGLLVGMVLFSSSSNEVVRYVTQGGLLPPDSFPLRLPYCRIKGL